MIISCQRHKFDIPADIAYLNTAYMSPLMKSVSAAMAQGGAFKQHPWTYGPADFFTFVEETRGRAAQIFGARSDDMAIIPSVSYGIQIAANALPLNAGQKVLVLQDQFPSNVYPWQNKADGVGATVEILPLPEDNDWTRVVLEAIDKDTAIVAIPQTHWSSGATFDLVVIRKALDAIDAALVLDLTQSLGAQPFDVKTVRPDFAICATYKWLLGPYSCGFVYIAPKWQEAEPLEHNWINREGSEDFSGLTHYRSTFQPGARRFDMGEKSNAAQMLGASAALTQILEWGVDNIAQTLSEKTNYIADQLRPLGFTAHETSLRAGHYLGLKREGGLPKNLVSNLASNNVFVSVRGPAMRVTPHLYTTDNDIERLVSVLKDKL